MNLAASLSDNSEDGQEGIGLFPQQRSHPVMDGFYMLDLLEARVGIEPTHKGFAVLVITSKRLIKLGFFVECSACLWSF